MQTLSQFLRLDTSSGFELFAFSAAAEQSQFCYIAVLDAHQIAVHPPSLFRALLSASR